MAVTITSRGTTFNTNAGDKTVTATPAVGDYIVVVAPSTGVATTAVVDDQGGTYTRVGSTRTGYSASGNLNVWVRDTFITSAVSTIWTATQTGSTGGGLSVLSVAGMTLGGIGGVRSTGGQSSGTTGTTPAPVLNQVPLLANPVIIAIANGSSPAVITPRTGYTETFDNGYTTPSAGMEVQYRVSGETSDTLTVGSTSPAAFTSIGIELNASPTVTATAIAKTDDFNDNSTDTTIWPNNFNGTGNVMAETGGQVSITLGGVLNAYSAYYDSTNTYDFTSKYAYVKATTVPGDALTSTQAYMKLELDSTNYVAIGKQGANLYMQRQLAGVDSITTLTFDTANHIWWQLASENGVFYWLTSPNGLVWTVVRSMVNPFAVTALKVSIGAGTFAVQTGSTFNFDSFNTVITAPGNFFNFFAA